MAEIDWVDIAAFASAAIALLSAIISTVQARLAAKQTQAARDSARAAEQQAISARHQVYLSLEQVHLAAEKDHRELVEAARSLNEEHKLLSASTRAVLDALPSRFISCELSTQHHLRMVSFFDEYERTIPALVSTPLLHPLTEYSRTILQLWTEIAGSVTSPPDSFTFDAEHEVRAIQALDAVNSATQAYRLAYQRWAYRLAPSDDS